MSAAADVARRGDHRCGGGRARADHDRGGGRTSTRGSRRSRTARGPVRVHPRGSDPRTGRPEGRSTSVRASRGLHRRRDRAAHVDRLAGRAVDRAREAVRRRPGAGWRSSRRWPASPRRSRSRSTSRSRSRRSSGRRSSRSARRAPPSCSRTAGSRGRKARPVRTPCASPCGGEDGRSASSSSIATRRSPTTTASCSTRSRTRPRSRSSTGGRAPRRARPGDPPSCQEQPPDRRVAPPAPGARRERGPRQGARRLRPTASSRSPPSTRS